MRILGVLAVTWQQPYLIIELSAVSVACHSKLLDAKQWPDRICEGSSHEQISPADGKAETRNASLLRDRVEGAFERVLAAKPFRPLDPTPNCTVAGPDPGSAVQPQSCLVNVLILSFRLGLGLGLSPAWIFLQLPSSSLSSMVILLTTDCSGIFPDSSKYIKKFVVTTA